MSATEGVPGGHGDCDHEIRSIISDIWPDENDEDGVYCEAGRKYREVIENESSEGFTGSPIHWADLARLLHSLI